MCAFQSLLQILKLLYSQYKSCSVTCCMKQALIHGEERRELQLSYLHILLQKNPLSSMYCFHQHAKETLNSHWVKSWNTPELRDKTRKPIFSRGHPKHCAKEPLFSPFLHPQTREPLDLPRDLNVSEETEGLSCASPLCSLITLHFQDGF